MQNLNKIWIVQTGFVVAVLWIVLILGCGQKREGKVTRQLPFDTANDNISQRHLANFKLREHKFTGESEWDSRNNFKKYKKKKHQFNRRKGNKVYGWHMYSEGSAYKNYNFSILSGVIYFSYELEPNTGGYKKIHAWEKTSLVDSAKAHNCKVFLSATNFGKQNNHTFLTSYYAQENFLKTITKLLKNRDANGVVLDFENIGGEDRDNFSEFIKDFSAKLKTYDPAYQLIVCLYALDYRKVFDIKAIDPYVDEYILMAQDYYGSFSRESGPVAPLYNIKDGLDYSISASVREYLRKGVKPYKMVLGLPYYGAKWTTSSTAAPSTVKKFISHPTYAQTKDRVIKNKLRAAIDTKSVTRYLIETRDNAVYQTWYDDDLTLATKFDWSIKQGLAGVAPWTPGYSGHYESLWLLLNAKFGQPTNHPPVTHAVGYLPNIPNGQKTLTRYHTKKFFSQKGKYQKTIQPNYKPWAFKKNGFFDEDKTQSHLIYGFYPFWNDDKKLQVDFRLYSRIGYFAAVPDPASGKIKNTFGWDRLDIPLAQKYGCKVDLVVANYSGNRENPILKNQKHLDILTSEVLRLIKAKKANGVTLDFGTFPESDSENFIYLVKKIKEALQQADGAYKLNCMLPQVLSSNKKRGYNFIELSTYVDYYLVTGFDYHGMHSKHAGPNAPLKAGLIWGEQSISKSLSDYFANGLVKEKLILVVPYFGKQWQTENEKIPSKVKGMPHYYSYSDFKRIILPHSRKTFDKESYTPCYHQKNGDKAYQTWIDDSASLAIKYNFVIQNKIAGIGIWSIGYDAGFPELDKLIVSKFFTQDNKPYVPKNTGSFFKRLIEELKRKPLLMALFITDLILVFLIVCFLALSLKVCLFKYLLSRYIYFFYALGFFLFIGTYFLFRQIQAIPDDGTIAVAMFIGLVCLILLKSMIDNKIKRTAP